VVWRFLFIISLIGNCLVGRREIFLLVRVVQGLVVFEMGAAEASRHAQILKSFFGARIAQVQLVGIAPIQIVVYHAKIPVKFELQDPVLYALGNFLIGRQVKVYKFGFEKFLMGCWQLPVFNCTFLLD
jgi:hypothetical protein